MKKLIILAGVLAASTFSSCKKDKSEQNPEPNPVTRYLTKITEKRNNVTTVHTLAYDANKRLQSVISNDNIEKVFFTYDAAGNLTKVEEFEEEFHNIYTYAYTNNAPVSGTLKSWHKEPNQQEELIEDDILTYTVENNQVSKMNIKFTLGDDAEVDFTFSYTNGNLTRAMAGNGALYDAKFTFGTKKNAFPQVTKWVLDQAGFSLRFSAKNEITTLVYDFPGSQLDNTITNTYTFNANGYPATMNDGESQFTFEYQ